MKRGKLYKREQFNLGYFTNSKKKIRFSIRKNYYSDYNIKLRAKQKIKRIYLIKEKQFFNYIKKCFSKPIKLLYILESRLDSILYRTGLFKTIKEVKQFINHKNVIINNNLNNISSTIIKINDILILKKKIINISSNKNFYFYKNKILILKIPFFKNIKFISLQDIFGFYRK
ncbi:S4 domain-containing protein [Candidatus Vidania fulgoroideorum]